MRFFVSIVLLLLYGCLQGTIPQRVIQIEGGVGRDPDLFLNDGSPCWYLRQDIMYPGRLFCDIEDNQSTVDEGGHGHFKHN